MDALQTGENGKSRLPVLVLGARQYAPVFADAFEGAADIVGFVENLDRLFCEHAILDRPVYWINEIAGLAASHLAICCLATVRRSGFVQQVAAQGFTFATLVHPSAMVSRRSELAGGVSLDAGVIVAGFSHVGAHVRVGRGATIGHHTRIGEFSTLHLASNVAGNCVIEPKVTVGMGASIIDGCRVGTGSYVAAGAAVTRDVPPHTLVGGVPARVLREDYKAP